jgi:hypothetical protein
MLKEFQCLFKLGSKICESFQTFIGVFLNYWGEVAPCPLHRDYK